jgi:hypothetical protein
MASKIFDFINGFDWTDIPENLSTNPTSQPIKSMTTFLDLSHDEVNYIFSYLGVCDMSWSARVCEDWYELLQLRFLNTTQCDLFVVKMRKWAIFALTILELTPSERKWIMKMESLWDPKIDIFTRQCEIFPKLFHFSRIMSHAASKTASVSFSAITSDYPIIGHPGQVDFVSIPPNMTAFRKLQELNQITAIETKAVAGLQTQNILDSVIDERLAEFKYRLSKKGMKKYNLVNPNQGCKELLKSFYEDMMFEVFNQPEMVIGSRDSDEVKTIKFRVLCSPLSKVTYCEQTKTRFF